MEKGRIRDTSKQAIHLLNHTDMSMVEVAEVEGIIP